MRTGCDSRTASLIVSLAVVLSLAAPVLAQDCPELVGGPMGQMLTDVAVSSGYAYVTSLDTDSLTQSLRVIAVNDPYHPLEVGFIDFDSPSVPAGVGVSGSYAYVADWFAGLRVIDVSTPSAPVEVGSVGPWPGWSQDVAVSGDYAYVVNGKSGSWGYFSVIDVSEPSAPAEVGFLWGSRYGVAASGGYAYAVGPGYFEVIDVSEPTAPVEVGYLYAGGYGVAVSGNYAYIAFGDEYSPRGLYVIDVSSPTAPVEVGLLDTPRWALDVAVSRGYAYVAMGDYDYRGLYVIDVSEPTAPVEVGFYETAGAMADLLGGVAVSDGYVFLANGGGLFIFRECSPLFADGFESGDTSAWSATVP
jgi:hypothetical protein